MNYDWTGQFCPKIVPKMSHAKVDLTCNRILFCIYMLNQLLCNYEKEGLSIATDRHARDR